jgi:hypothetical protein
MEGKRKGTELLWSALGGVAGIPLRSLGVARRVDEGVL